MRLKKERRRKTLFHVFIVFISISIYNAQVSSYTTNEFKNFRVPVNNKEQWMNIIQSHQPDISLNFDSKIHICDKHFNDEDILTHGINRKSLRKGALPNLVYVYVYIIEKFD